MITMEDTSSVVDHDHCLWQTRIRRCGASVLGLASIGASPLAGSRDGIKETFDLLDSPNNSPPHLEARLHPKAKLRLDPPTRIQAPHLRQRLRNNKNGTIRQSSNATPVRKATPAASGGSSSGASQMLGRLLEIVSPDLKNVIRKLQNGNVPLSQRDYDSILAVAANPQNENTSAMNARMMSYYPDPSSSIANIEGSPMGNLVHQMVNTSYCAGKSQCLVPSPFTQPRQPSKFLKKQGMNRSISPGQPYQLGQFQLYSTPPSPKNQSIQKYAASAKRKGRALPGPRTRRYR